MRMLSKIWSEILIEIDQHDQTGNYNNAFQV